MLSNTSLPWGSVNCFCHVNFCSEQEWASWSFWWKRQWLNACFIRLVLSAAAKKAASASPEVAGDKGEAGEGEKEGVNGEVEGESNGKVKEGEGAACGSKLRACRRAGGGEASGAGKSLGQSSGTVSVFGVTPFCLTALFQCTDTWCRYVKNVS